MTKKGKGKKMMMMMKRNKGWKILMKKGMRMKVKKMKMRRRGRKERKMKEKMTSGTLMDANLLFSFSPVPGSKCSVLFFFLLCSVSLLLTSLSYASHHGSHLI